MEWIGAAGAVAVEVASIQGWFAIGGGIITLVGGIIALVVSNSKKRQQSYADTTEIKDHVANDHSKNLREDIDEKHAEVIGLLQSHIQQTTQEFGHMRAEMGELRRNFEDERTRTRILEDAISGKAKTPRR